MQDKLLQTPDAADTAMKLRDSVKQYINEKEA